MTILSADIHLCTWAYILAGIKPSELLIYHLFLSSCNIYGAVARNLTVWEVYLQDPKFHFNIPIDYWSLKQSHALIFSFNMCGDFVPTKENYVMSPVDWSTNDRRLTFTAWPITDVAKHVHQRCHSATWQGGATGSIQMLDTQYNSGSKFFVEERRRYPPCYAHVYKILPEQTPFLILRVKLCNKT